MSVVFFYNQCFLSGHLLSWWSNSLNRILLRKFVKVSETVHKFGVEFCMFLKETSYAHQGCIYLIKNIVKQKYCKILSQFQITIFCIYFKWIFSIITPSFSVTRSFRNILICWYAAQETILSVIDVENNCFLEQKFQKNNSYLKSIYF